MNKLKKVIKQSSTLSGLLAYYQRKANPNFVNEVERRKGIDLFDYHALATPLSYYPYFTVKDNNLYGSLFQFSRYINNENALCGLNNIIAEHGLIFGNLVQKHLLYSYPKSILTFSNYRKAIIEQFSSKEVITAGPYIHYATPIIDQQKQAQIKKKLGRVLLVFPSHSIPSVEKKFDKALLVSEIEKYQKHYDNVLVCLYWRDVEIGNDKFYLDKGYKVVTAGHINDWYFLSRLKYIISLSDMTMSNSIGTQIGYCLYLGKSHFLFNQSVNFEKTSNQYKNEIGQFKSISKSQREVSDIIRNAFSDFDENIFPNQLDLMNEIWGFDQIKTPIELYRSIS